MEFAARLEGAAPGGDNMARDAALGAEAARSGRALLRLYAWEPPAVSLGYHQKEEEACDAEACRVMGWDVVRRPTGGRAVCHARDEVTYAVALPAAAAPPGVLGCYAWLAGGLLAGYRRLGLPAALAPGARPEGRSGACFDAAAPDELCCGGRKVAGSAQVRREGFVLQHGSLPRTFDAALHARLLGLPPAAARRLARRAAGIADFLDPAPAWADVAAAVAGGLVQALAAGPPNAAPDVAEGRPGVGGAAVLVIHGPNLNLLGRREPEVYGRESLETIDARLRALGVELGVAVDCVQHNGEGEIVTAIQGAPGRYAGIVINPAGYTHTSVAVRDALAAVAGMGVPAVEVHLSQPAAREAFRHVSLVAPVCRGSVSGFGPDGYALALRGLVAGLAGAGGRP